MDTTSPVIWTDDDSDDPGTKDNHQGGEQQGAFEAHVEPCLAPETEDERRGAYVAHEEPRPATGAVGSCPEAEAQRNQSHPT